MNFKPGRPSVVKYINYRGESAYRAFIFKHMYYGSTSYHKDPQWLIVGFDLHKRANRTYALSDMNEADHIDNLDMAIIEIMNYQKAALVHNLRMLLVAKNDQYHNLRMEKLKSRLNKLSLFGLLEFSEPTLFHPRTTVRLKSPSKERLSDLRERLSHRLGALNLEPIYGK